MFNNQNSNTKPFIPLQETNTNNNDVKSVLQKQIKILKPEEYYFLSYLISQNRLYAELSQLQDELNQDPTFSLRKVFEFFDTNGDHMIQFEDFYITLQKLDIVLKKEELYRVFQKLGGEDDQIISYAEFASLFKFQKIPLWTLPRNEQSYILNEAQQVIVQQIFNIYTKMEKSLMVLQEQLGNLEFIMQLFKKLDNSQKGYLIYDDIVKYLGNMGIKIKHEYKRVFTRIQKYKSGRVSFDEFIWEFGCKSTLEEYKQEEDKKSQVQNEEPQHDRQQSYVNDGRLSPRSQLYVVDGQKPSILNEYVHKPRMSLNDSDESIRLPGFTRYIFQQ